MILDARSATASTYARPFTLSAAVANAIHKIPVGGSLDVSSLITQTGDEMTLERVNMFVNKVRGEKRFSVRTTLGGKRIWRIA